MASEERSTQISMAPSPSEHVSGKSVVSATAAPAKAPTREVQDTGAASPTSSSGRLGAEAQMQERQRLQDMVKKFSKQAVLGTPCSVLSLDAGSKAPGTYTMDKSLRRLTVSTSGGGKHAFSLSSATCFRGDESSLMSHQAVKNLGEKSLPCMVHVQVSDENGHADHLLIMSDAMDADTFLTCMKVLKLYGQTVTPSA